MRKIFKGVKKAMTIKIDECREVLSCAQNRLILGLMIIGLGVGLGTGLIASAYLKVN